MSFAIPALGAVTQGLSLPGVSAAAGTSAAPGAAGAAGGSFGDLLAKGLDNLQAVQAKSDHLAVQAATGDLTDVHDYMVAASEASVATELTVAVRNKAVEAFNQIMGMQM